MEKAIEKLMSVAPTQRLQILEMARKHFPRGLEILIEWKSLGNEEVHPHELCQALRTSRVETVAEIKQSLPLQDLRAEDPQIRFRAYRHMEKHPEGFIIALATTGLGDKKRSIEDISRNLKMSPSVVKQTLHGLCHFINKTIAASD